MKQKMNDEEEMRLDFSLTGKDVAFPEVACGFVDSMPQDKLINKEHLNVANEFSKNFLIVGNVGQVIPEQKQVRIATDVKEEIIRLILLIDIL
jgi:hypothetical protein